MTMQERMKFSQRYARFSRQPQGLFGKILTLVAGGIFLILAFMFSLVILAVVVVGGLLLGGWLWWKTRAARKLRREQGRQPASEEGYVIEGEVIRETREPASPDKLLR